MLPACIQPYSTTVPTENHGVPTCPVRDPNARKCDPLPAGGGRIVLTLAPDTAGGEVVHPSPTAERVSNVCPETKAWDCAFLMPQKRLRIRNKAELVILISLQ